MFPITLSGNGAQRRDRPSALQRLGPPLAVTALLGLTACATAPATAGQDMLQHIVVSTSTPDGEPVSGVDCVLSNDQGEWRLTSPDSALVKRSRQPLAVLCENERWQAAKGGAGYWASSGSSDGRKVLAGAAAGGAVTAAGGAAILSTAGAASLGMLSAMGPLMIVGVLTGAAIGLARSGADRLDSYSPTVVFLVEPRKEMAIVEPLAPDPAAL